MLFKSHRITPDHFVELEFVGADGIHRRALSPGDDISDLPAEVQQAIRLDWLPSVVAAYRAANQPAAPTAAEIMDRFAAAIQVRIDQTAQERHYDSMQSAVSYRGDPNPQFAAEAEALFEWRSAVWTYATAELEKVKAGQRPQPNIAEFVVELPSFVWPEVG